MSVKLGAGLEHSENNFGTPPGTDPNSPGPEQPRTKLKSRTNNNVPNREAKQNQ